MGVMKLRVPFFKAFMIYFRSRSRGFAPLMIAHIEVDASVVIVMEDAVSTVDTSIVVYDHGNNEAVSSPIIEER